MPRSCKCASTRIGCRCRSCSGCSSPRTIPTTRNRQGADIGAQYRSAIYFSDESQRDVIARVLAEANDELGGRVVTEVEPLANYSAAEAYHQHYFANNPDQGYCAAVIGPKIEKFSKVFRNRLAE